MNFLRNIPRPFLTDRQTSITKLPLLEHARRKILKWQQVHKNLGLLQFFFIMRCSSKTESKHRSFIVYSQVDSCAHLPLTFIKTLEQKYWERRDSEDRGGGGAIVVVVSFFL